MTQTAPTGWHSVTPRLFVDDPETLASFLREAFDATGNFQTTAPSEIRLGDSIVMVSGTDVRPATQSFMYLYLEDIDATYARALKAGAVSFEEPKDVPYGDRRAMIQDPCGNTWQIATMLVPR